MNSIPDALNAAIQHHQAGRLPEAEALYRQILQVQPDHADVLHCLGVLAGQTGQHASAYDLISRALSLRPDFAEAHTNLSNALKELGKLEEAVSHCREALRLKPDCADAYNNLGVALLGQGSLEEAEVQFRQALALRPDYAEAHNNLGIALQSQGRLKEAAANYQQALALAPAYVKAYNNLANTLREQGELQEAVACFRRALAIEPDYAQAHSNLIYVMYYSPAYTAESIAAELRRWNDLHALPLARQRRPHNNDRNPERCLRVGYVSADFCRHAASYFIEPLLAAHDHANLEVFCYSSGVRSDEATHRVRTLADAWRNITGLSDEAVAELVRADAIDILVDFSNHTAGNRLLVFARKPAPVQVAYGGTGGTTGLSTMDFRLVDRYLSPSDSAEWSSEELIRLPACAACYRPSAEAPPVAPLPVLANGYVTFGSFNNLAKVTPDVVSLWAQILRSVPESRLILKDGTLVDQAQRERYLDLFQRHWIGADRLELLPRTALPDYLATYGRVDIGLDPFPYNGCTTTCEAIWMGVPVITLAGSMVNSRMGVTLLSNLGLGQLVATTPEAYVQSAVTFAADPKKLAVLRSKLRTMMQASPLCADKALAQSVEDAYRLMWRRWCESAGKG